MAIAMQVDVQDAVIKQFYPFVQSEKGAGKWLVMTFNIGDKAAKADLTKFACHKKKYDDLKKKATKKYDDAKKSLQTEDEAKEEAEPAAWKFVADPEDALDKKAVSKHHHGEFVAAMKSVAEDGKRPAIGVIELFTKVFYVTYCSDNHCERKHKMAFSTCRDGIKRRLATTNADVQGTDMGDLDFDEFEKLAPKI